MNSIWQSAPIRTPLAADTPAAPTAPVASAESKGPAVAPPYFSPVVRIDPETAMAIWQVRNPETGAIVYQYPAAATIKAYRSHMHDDPAPQRGTGTVAPPTATATPEAAHKDASPPPHVEAPPAKK